MLHCQRGQAECDEHLKPLVTIIWTYSYKIFKDKLREVYLRIFSGETFIVGNIIQSMELGIDFLGHFKHLPVNLHHDMPISEDVEPSHPGQMLGLLALSFSCPPQSSKLPPLGAQYSRLTDLVAPVKHAGHSCFYS